MCSQTDPIQFYLSDLTSQKSILSEVLPDILPALAAEAFDWTIADVAADAITEFVFSDKGGFLVVFYGTAQQAVESALLQGMHPSAALAQWEQSISRLLAVYRKHRRQMILVNDVATCQDPQGFLQALAGRLGQSTPPLAEWPVRQPASGIVERVIALQTVAQSVSAKRLGSELEASALPFGNRIADMSCDVDAAFDAHLQGHEIKATADLLEQQLHSVQEELESTVTQTRDRQQQQDRKLQETRAETAAAQKQVTELKQRIAAADKKHANDMAALQESAKKESARLNTGLQGVEKELKAALGREKNLLQQLAAVKKQLAKAADPDKVEKENTLLLMQLHNVQEELESYYQETRTLRQTEQDHLARIADLEKNQSAPVLQDRVNALEKIVRDAENNLQIARDSLKQRDHEVGLLRDQLGGAQEQLDQHREELEALLHSTSWRATGPLRRLKDRLRSE